MNLRDMEYLVAVAEFSHFGRAAAHCHVSQPALSGQIRKLEEHLGVALFERTNKSVHITPVGAEIAAHAKEMLAIVETIEETAAAHRDPLSGSLRLGMIPTIAPYLTPRLLRSLRHGLPKLDLRLSENMTEILERQLIVGDIDAAILATPVPNPRLEEIPLYDEPFWIALPHGHPLESREEIDVSEIGVSDLLLLADGHCLRDQVLSFCRVEPGASAAVNTQETSLTTVLALVGAGAGVTLVPAMSLEGGWVTDAGIAMRREKSGNACRAVRLAYRASYPRRAALEKIADIVCASVPDTVTPVRR